MSDEKEFDFDRSAFASKALANAGPKRLNKLYKDLGNYGVITALDEALAAVEKKGLVYELLENGVDIERIR